MVETNKLECHAKPAINKYILYRAVYANQTKRLAIHAWFLLGGTLDWVEGNSQRPVAAIFYGKRRKDANFVRR